MPIEPIRSKSFEKFFSENWILIADAVASARSRLAASLVELGAKRNRMISVGTFEEAQNALTEKKPRIVLCDYQLGGRSGLDLLQEQRAAFPQSSESLFILVTGNTSQSAVAQAAEEDVDAFILKPFTKDSLLKTLDRAIRAKLEPSPYVLKVEEGKQLLLGSRYDEAILAFDAALALEAKPSLAHFYRGQAEQMKNALANAGDDYKKGLAFQKIHYKCLVGLFDLLQSQGRNADAYDVVRRVVQYFPANPKRLASVLRLAIVTQSFQDVEGYYQIFTQLEAREEQLIRYVCSAMSVTGKYYLRNKVNGRALELFEKSLITAGGRPNFNRFVIETLIENKFVDEARKHMKRFPAALTQGLEYSVCDYLITDAGCQPVESLHLGRSLLNQGVEDPLLYKILIRRSVEVGKLDFAQEWSQMAMARWPERAEDFKIVDLAGSA